MPSFTTTLLLTGNNVGIVVPEEVVESFGAGKRVPVIVTINGYSYPSTIAVMGGQYLVGVATVHREAAGVAGGQPRRQQRPCQAGEHVTRSGRCQPWRCVGLRAHRQGRRAG